MDIAKLANPTVRGAVEALQWGDKEAWASQFAADATLFDDGEPRSLAEFTRDALGHDRFAPSRGAWLCSGAYPKCSISNSVRTRTFRAGC